MGHALFSGLALLRDPITITVVGCYNNKNNNKNNIFGDILRGILEDFQLPRCFPEGLYGHYRRGTTLSSLHPSLRRDIEFTEIHQ